MPLEAGSRYGPYEILSPLGAGGMGEVYRARDTRLERTVAIKVLPAHIAKREDLRQRFEREARAVSGLNHPHICVLHDIGRQDGIDYMVMECLEGETLAARLGRGALPLDQALKYAMQIADALDRAHRGGVLHRDVKPSNVMLTRDGVKVLDFGLAKTGAKQPAGEETLSAALTTEGAILGTPQYMAPELYEGKEADERSDIFGFGCVVYEMVTGRRAFDGKTRASVVAAVLGAEPPSMSSIQPVSPPLERLVARCLAKDTEERWQSIRDVLLELRSIASGPEPVGKAKAGRPWATWALAAVAFVAALAIGVIHFSQSSPPLETIRFEIHGPEHTTLRQALSVSPDGRNVAYIAVGADGKRAIWVRSFDSLTAQPVAGTEQANAPFWSPDSRQIAFLTSGKLQKVAVRGGPAQTLCDAAGGGAWSAEGLILYQKEISGPIHRVPATGGACSPITSLDTAAKETSHSTPHFLPDSRHFLYSIVSSSDEHKGIYAGSLDGKLKKRLVEVTAGWSTSLLKAEAICYTCGSRRCWPKLWIQAPGSLPESQFPSPKT